MLNLLIIVCVIISIILNVVVSYVLAPFATPEEIKPPFGANKLSFKSQFMHMFVHHKQVKLTSSLIVGVVTGLSVYLGIKLLERKKLK